MSQASQLHLHRLLVAAESESTSISETSLSGDEGTSFLEEKEKGFEEHENGVDIEKADDTNPSGEKEDEQRAFLRMDDRQHARNDWHREQATRVSGVSTDWLQVFTNKAIFEDPSLRLNQSTFAAFHFTVTGATLYAISRPSIGVFTPSRARFLDMMPLALAMCMNVILPNLSLAFSTVAFYQIVRVLLTPLVAGINFVVYETRIPRKAVWTLVPICIGVALVSYYDTKAVAGEHVKTTSMAGMSFAFAGVLASSLYTVWIGTYQKKFEMSSMQLLFNQAPISAFLLLYVIPFTDQPPAWSQLPMWKWKLVAVVRFWTDSPL
jgi:solute carrier family 35 protein E3